MQTYTQGRRRARGPVSGGIEVLSVRKAETGFQLHGVTSIAEITPVAHSVANDGDMSNVHYENAAKLACSSAQGPTPANAIGMTRQERLQALERHLLRPFPHPTEFYLIDRIGRLTACGSLYVALDELIDHAMQPDNVCPFRLGMVLSAAVRAGALEKLGPQNGREGSYRITDIGQRYLDQAKAMRAALWKINPLLSIEEICAIVQIEGGDTLSEMITMVKDEEALKAERRRQEKKRSARKNATGGLNQSMGAFTAHAASPTTHDDSTAVANGTLLSVHFALHPLWAGLTLPIQRESYPTK